MLFVPMRVEAECLAYCIRLEGSRRIGEHWKVELEARARTGVDQANPMHPFHCDAYVQLPLSQFFMKLASALEAAGSVSVFRRRV